MPAILQIIFSSYDKVLITLFNFLLIKIWVLYLFKSSTVIYLTKVLYLLIWTKIKLKMP